MIDFVIACREKENKKQFVHMGCYGIGVSRIIQAIFEQHKDENWLIWQKDLSAYKVHLVSLGDGKIKDRACEIYDKLIKEGISVFWDDRN